MKIIFSNRNNQQTVDESQNWNQCLEQVGKFKDKQAFVALFTHFSPRLKSFLANGSNQQAENVEELVQETMIKVWRKASNYSTAQGSASTWIYTIARNTRIDFFRKQARQNPLMLHADDIFEDNQDTSPDSTLVKMRTQGNVRDQLRALPKEQYEVLSMMYYHGKSGQQVADALDLPLGTVKSRIRLAMAKMKLGLSPAYADINEIEGHAHD